MLVISKSSRFQPGLWSRSQKNLNGGAGARNGAGARMVEPERECWSRSEKCRMLAAGAGTRNLSSGSTVLVPISATLPLAFICKFFKAGCKSVSSSRMAFPPVLYMSRRLRYLLRMCSTGLKLAQQHMSSETSLVILA